MIAEALKTGLSGPFIRPSMRELDDPRRLGLLEACICMMKGLGFLTVSEGVETAEQAELIRSLGGDAIQGYYCSKPLSESDFEQYLKEHA